MAQVRTGTGFDAHRFAEGRRLVLGGVTIEHDRGLLGHSDADVVCHAVMDAALGAACLGDIGKLFPDTEKRWKNADSIKLLGIVCELLTEHGWRVVHADATVIAEAPRLRPFVDEMRGNLAGAMGCEVQDVSVKATTVEGMGALGRGEGIAVMAAVTIEWA